MTSWALGTHFQVPCSQDEGAVSPLVLGLQEPPDELLDAGDVPPNLQHRAVLLCVGKVEGEHGLWAHVLLPNDPWENREGLCQGEWEWGMWLLLCLQGQGQPQLQAVLATG